MIPAVDDWRTKRKGEKRDRPWTPEHDMILLRLRAAGMTMSVIGERLGRSKFACANRADRITAAPKKIEPPKDFLGQRIEAYLGRIASLNDYTASDLKRECYGWR